MDIKKLILEKISKKGQIRISDIAKKTSFSRAYINRFFKELKEDGKIILVGKANRAHYVLPDKNKILKARKEILNGHYILKNKNLFEDEILDKIKKNTGIFLDLPKNIISIADYAFTEMLNNAIEHSKSQTIDVLAYKDRDFIRFSVIDKGIGIFNSIIKKYNLKNELEAIQELTKGKLTTVPERHTGEGIFFTSRAVDKLIIQSWNKKLIFDNILNDIFIEDAKKLKGTRVIFYIGVKSKRKLENIFREYSDKNFRFNKTKVVVNLYKIDTNYISRSQARRILIGLEKFKTVILDFSKVDTVGQAFADEVFRVWQKNHLNIKIQYQNANENIVFMIKRAGSQNRL
jgi:anti-sigma regulatory factor (Ser/Thr protein kinase)